MGQEVKELLEYFKDLDVTINPTAESDAEWTKDLDQVLNNLDICWKEGVTDLEAEEVLNSVVSLVIRIESKELTAFVIKTCNMYAKLPDDNLKRSVVKLVTLNNLFLGLATLNQQQCRYHVYMCLLNMAAKINQLHQIVTDPSKVAQWLQEWNCTAEEQQNLWRQLRKIHLDLGNTEKANAVMIKLLQSFTNEDASSARQDAIECITSALGEPSVLTVDHLLQLKPVQYLEGEAIHDLLTIFVTGNLSKLLEFKGSHAEFFASLGLVNEVVMTKMRLLTLMRITENKTELEYDVIQSELHLKPEEIEEFLIEAVRQKAVNLRLDQVHRRVLITGVIPQSFGRAQWVSLKEDLLTWQRNLDQIRGSLETMARSSQQGVIPP